MLKNSKSRFISAALLLGLSASAYAVWKDAQTVVYYTDSSMTEVSGYVMYYCQTTTRTLIGTSSPYSQVLYGGSCQEGGIPPHP